jgi:uncharacterized membrane protein
MPSEKASKRIKGESEVGTQEIVETIHTRRIFQGPLPEPEMLERYKNADASFPERIMRMAEAHNIADVKTKNRASFSSVAMPIIGQLFTLILGVGGIVACAYLAKAGFTGGAVATIAGSFSPMVINAFQGFRQVRR